MAWLIPAKGYGTATTLHCRPQQLQSHKDADVRRTRTIYSVALAIKDVRLALAEAERAAVPMPAESLVHHRLVGLVNSGWADLDWPAVGLLAACRCRAR